MAKRGRQACLDLDSDCDVAADAFAEAPRARRRRLSSRTSDRRAEEVQRSTSLASLERAAKRLKTSKAAERVLAVPQWNMDVAADAMRRAGVSGVVTNLSGTRRQRVECGEKRRIAVERAREDSALDAALLESAAIIQGVLRDCDAASLADAEPPQLETESGPKVSAQEPGAEDAAAPKQADAPDFTSSEGVASPEPAAAPTLVVVPTPEPAHAPAEPSAKPRSPSLAGRFFRAMAMAGSKRNAAGGDGVGRRRA